MDIKKSLTYAKYDATQNPAIVVDFNISKTCKSSSKIFTLGQKG
jgi:hypothetical protein